MKLRSGTGSISFQDDLESHTRIVKPANFYLSGFDFSINNKVKQSREKLLSVSVEPRFFSQLNQLNNQPNSIDQCKMSKFSKLQRLNKTL